MHESTSIRWHSLARRVTKNNKGDTDLLACTQRHINAHTCEQNTQMRGQIGLNIWATVTWDSKKDTHATQTHTHTL